MVDIEPYKMNKNTNIEEHNDMVSKINEIVDVINDTNLDVLKPIVDQNTADINALDTKVTKNTSDIAQLKISVAENETEIKKDQANISANAVKLKEVSDTVNLHTTEIDALTKELPTEISAISNNTGKIYIETELEDGTILTSSEADLKVPTSYNIVSGTTNRSFKLNVTLSDGTTYTTNDFVIPEGGGTSVSVTSINLVQTSDYGSFKVVIGLDDSTTIESAVYQPVVQTRIVKPTAGKGNTLRISANAVASETVNIIDNVVLSFADSKLKCTVNGVESSEVTISTEGTVYTAGTGISISDANAISVNSSVVAMKSDITDMETKTNANATFATKSTVTQLQTAVQDCFNEVSVNGSNLEFTALDGQVNSVAIPSGGLEEIDLDNFPSDFKEGDIIFATVNYEIDTSANSWNTKLTSANTSGKATTRYYTVMFGLKEGTFTIGNSSSYVSGIGSSATEAIGAVSIHPSQVTSWNTGSNLWSFQELFWNAAGMYAVSRVSVTKSNLKTYVNRMQRLR